jgi:hypothetical protein
MIIITLANFLLCKWRERDEMGANVLSGLEVEV